MIVATGVDVPTMVAQAAADAGKPMTDNVVLRRGPGACRARGAAGWAGGF